MGKFMTGICWETVTWRWFNATLQCRTLKVTENILDFRGKKRNLWTVFHKSAFSHINLQQIQLNNISEGLLFVVLNREGTQISNGVGSKDDRHSWLTASKKEDMCDGSTARGWLSFSWQSRFWQRVNMQHTRHCTRHRGLLMPECPSQWGCPVKSLGMTALLCFYTQVGRWIWS